MATFEKTTTIAEFSRRNGLTEVEAEAAMARL
ncbi:hypothetical protein QF010_000779 [Pseudomonas silensiensis]